MLRLCIVGGLGRMGRAIGSQAQSETDLMVAAVWEASRVIEQTPDYAGAVGYSKNPVLLTYDGREAVEGCDVVVDFAVADVFDHVVSACSRFGKPLVSGTTAVPDKDRRLGDLSARVAVVSAPNMAVGVNVVFGICESVGRILGKASDIEIVETHHRTKRDVPSGTALEIARLLSASTGKPITIGRTDDSPQRDREITIHSLRMGEVAGRHTVIFSPKGEVLEITHTAQSRACFAAGAVMAARFAFRAPPGLYSMLDVLGFKEGVQT